MSLRIATIIACVSLFWAMPVGAIQLNAPNAEYSADSITQTEDTTMKEHIYYTPTKERHEMNTQGGSNEEGELPTRIIRKDLKVQWMVMASKKMVMEQSLDRPDPRQKGSPDMKNWDFNESAVGEEVLNGVPVTKYKTIATSTDGKKFGGFTWRTKEGIEVKTDLLYKEGNEKQRMSTELQNLKIGKQDPQLFEIPAGYQKLDMSGMMGGMGGMMGGAMGREGMGRPGMGQPGMGRPDMSGQGMGRPNMPVPPPDAPASPEPPPTEQSDMQKAGDMMKKLFGR
jgi:hypothetical protein